jgi:MFS family permease
MLVVPPILLTMTHGRLRPWHGSRTNNQPCRDRRRLRTTSLKSAKLPSCWWASSHDTGGLGNALVSVNLPYLQGSLGVYSAEIQWLPAAYVMANVSMNLLLVKFRQQYGLRLFTELFLVLYAIATVAHLFVHGLDRPSPCARRTA